MPWLLLSLFIPFGAQTSGPDLKARVQRLIDSSGAEVAVVVRALDGKDELLIEPDKPFHAASTMKVPIMIELFRQAEAGRLRLDEPLAITNAFHSIVDGSVYQLSVGDDSDALVYKAIGTSLPLRELCEAMITVSSNFATNLLIERVGAENVRKTVTRLGADGMVVLRGVEDQKAFDRGLNNATTARALAALMQKLAAGEAVSPKADAEMVAMLKRQKFRDAIPSGLPEGTPVAHKTGTITKIHHDAAIVFGPRPYVLVLLVRGIQDQKVSGPLMASISREIWNEFSNPRRRQSWEWHLPPIPGCPGNWSRHQSAGPGAVEFRRIALTEGVAPGRNGGNTSRGRWVADTREWRRTELLTNH